MADAQMMFKKAVKYEAKGRVALIGPAGAGKSFTALALARALVGPEGKIAAIDTEHGSLSKYADLFDFDVIEMASFTPDAFMGALKAAEAAGYNAFICDSLSHFWIGKDGALEFVDMASKRYKDNMGGWKEFRTHERAMVDAMIASSCHIITTMRTKTDYQEEIDQKTGKKKRVKIGLAPIQRDGLEYEFDLVGYMDDDNTLVVDKTRCPAYSQKALSKPGAKEFKPFIDWLKGVAAPVYITRAQADEIFNLSKAKGIKIADFMAQAGVPKLSELRLDKLDALTQWVASYKAPAEDPSKAYDSEIESLVKVGVSFNDLGDYVEGLPFAGDLPSVTLHLRGLREKKTPQELIATLKRPKAEPPPTPTTPKEEVPF